MKFLKSKKIAASIVTSLMLLAPFSNVEAKVVDLQILATSDTHGKFYPWDYALNQESKSGSMVQLSTAIKSLRNENTILLDAGDTIQDNSAQIFLNDKIHPMIFAMNELKYDAWTTGNHEYNYGMDVLKKIIKQQKAKVLVANVFDKDNKPLADGYTIIEKDGVKVGIIGVVTPNIKKWDSENLKDCTVENPGPVTREIIDKIKDKVDVIVGLMHMSVDDEYNVECSGVKDIADLCPELDVIIAAHGHMPIEGLTENGVLIVENKFQAATMSEINLTVDTEAKDKKVIAKKSKLINIKDYEPDVELMKKLEPFHNIAVNDANKVIGELKGGNLIPESELPNVNSGLLMETPLVNLINEVELYYTGADVAAASVFDMNSYLNEGTIHKSDLAKIYKYGNTLYKVQVTGKQLKQYMENSVTFYNQYKKGDLTISFKPGKRLYEYRIFSGVNYEINISKEEGNRIENLTWPDGRPVKDDDIFTLAVNNYDANSCLLTPDVIYEKDDMPKCIDIDVRGDIGGIRELIGEYISNVNKGVISPKYNNNWKITGTDWDMDKHNKAIQMLKEGKLQIINSEDGRSFNVKSITENELL